MDLAAVRRVSVYLLSSLKDYDLDRLMYPDNILVSACLPKLMVNVSDEILRESLFLTFQRLVLNIVNCAKIVAMF